MPEQETAVSRNGWTMNTLFIHMEAQFEALIVHQEAQITDLRRLLDERYATQTKALDAAFSAASLGVATALQSAREASTKAEENAEKRFDSFRSESSSQIKSVSEKQGDESARIADRINELTTRLDVTQGQGTGTKADVRIAELSARLDEEQGKATGTSKYQTQLIAVVGVAIAATALITRLLFP